MTALDQVRESLKLALRLQALLEPGQHIGNKQQARDICAELVKRLTVVATMEPKGDTQ